MSDIPIHSISAVDAATDAALLALNNAHIRETSHLSPEAWRELIGQSFAATCVDGDGALLIVLDHDADYDNANFDWFRARYQRFAYVDRIIVAERLRGQGAAEALYRHLFEQAAAAGLERVVCEINLDPPNPASDAFHARLEFDIVGEARLEDRGKTVRYFVRELAPH